jgi:tRNA (guanine-N7-)-methyltransferase
MNGSHLFQAGRYAQEGADALAFLKQPGPATLEIGFDHGMCLADRARRWPGTLHLGLEIREARVNALRPHLSANAFAWRADARTVLASVLPPGRLATIYVFFPDPIWTESHRDRRLLFSPAFIALCARALTPDGTLHLTTDVEPYFHWVETLLSLWSPAAAPDLGTELSRRERVCKRDGLEVWRGTWRRPAP